MKKTLVSLIIFLVLALGIFLVIGLFNNNPPKPLITIESENVEVAQGSYCWRGVINSRCIDMTSPPDIIKRKELKPVVVSPKDRIKIEFKKEPKVGTLNVNRWISNEETKSVSLNEDFFIAPKENGVYVYDVSANWERGSASYAFVFEVK